MSERLGRVINRGSGDFGTWVRLRRRRLELTQEELAELSGVSVRTVQSLESGRVGGSRPATRRRIIEALSGPERQPRPAVVPARLPRGTATVTGRGRELSYLDDLLAVAESDEDESPVVVISGVPGAGKTALALHWANRVASRFPDGQLHLDLRGFGPDRQLTPSEALGSLLGSLGIPEREAPRDEAEAAARYRTLLADRRVLVLLDNAAAADQVRPLLPGSRHCFVIVTSRDSLAGLVARDGAHRLALAAPSVGEALAPGAGEARTALENEVGDLLAITAFTEDPEWPPSADPPSDAPSQRAGEIGDLVLETRRDETRLAIGGIRDARQRLREALARYLELGTPEAKRFRERLATLGVDLAVALPAGGAVAAIVQPRARHRGRSRQRGR